ncbi:MAG TPA: glycosyltransferase family A protein, partial [Lacunisphaera sp.]|nr:glycosyltransferase family A protein [Lacunisphaera sp.]
WPATEVIVINDGSKDRSLEIAQGFASRGVQVIDQPNRGASAARNHGLRVARGKFIQFLDADDVLAPDKIALQMQALAAAGPDMLASGSWGRFDRDPRRAVFATEAVAQARTAVEFLQLHYETGTMMQPGAWLAARSLLDRAGPWDETLSLNDDGEYFARVMLAARGLVHVAAARCYYRSGMDGSLSRRTDPAALDSLYRSVELTLRHLRAADDSPRTRAACADAWMRVAFEVYPAMPDLAAKAEAQARALGGSQRPLPGSGRFQLAARFLGWRLARRLFP